MVVDLVDARGNTTKAHPHSVILHEELLSRRALKDADIDEDRGVGADREEGASTWAACPPFFSAICYQAKKTIARFGKKVLLALGTDND